MRTFLRILFLIAAALTVFLALTPLPIGQLIESGEQRHLIAFSVLPLLSSLAWPSLGFVRHWMLYALGGVAIEWAQGWMHVGRQAELVDWVVDCVAAAITLLLVALWRRPGEQRTAPVD